MTWLLAKPRTFSNLPAFLDLHGRIQFWLKYRNSGYSLDRYFKITKAIQIPKNPDAYSENWLSRALIIKTNKKYFLKICCVFKSILFHYYYSWDTFYKNKLTDTGEDSKLVHRRKRPKMDTLFSSLFSDASERRV